MTPDKPRVLCVLPLLGHPRHAKRIEMLKEAGFDVEVAAFERKYHKGRIPACPVKKLGAIDHGRYVSRCFKIARAIPAIRQAIKRNDSVYAFGPDLALISLLSGLGTGKPVVVEVGDITELQVAKGPKGRIVRRVERWIVNWCRLIVVTAPRYLDEYYRQWVNTKTKGLVLENKLEASFVQEVKSRSKNLTSRLGTPLVDRPLRIGYFGLLRDEWSWQVLESLAQAQPDRVEVILAGLPMAPIEDLPERTHKHCNIHYLGEFRSPDDLPSLYGDVDMVWACYPPIRPWDWIFRWARPNRFYQSCLFQKPTFTRDGSQDAVDVEKYRIGMIIAEVDVEETVEAILKITISDLQLWRDNISKVPPNVYSYSNEGAELGATLRRLIANGS